MGCINLLPQKKKLCKGAVWRFIYKYTVLQATIYNEQYTFTRQEINVQSSK